MRRVILLLLVLIPLAPARADALTIRDIVELSRAGLGDEVLLALIEVDRSVFSIDTASIKALKAAGVSEKVIAAVVRSGRTPPAVDETPAPAPDPVPVQDPQPQVIVIDHHDESQAGEVFVPYAVPVFVPVARRGFDRNRSVNRSVAVQEFGRTQELGRTQDFNRTTTPTLENNATQQFQRRSAQPVYWGGSLRPDAWQPSRPVPAPQPASPPAHVKK